MVSRRIPRVLSIAGSDSGGGAGIQADLKAFAFCGVHGMTAVTAVTAQNTLTVTAVHHVPGEIIEAQVRAVVEDIGVDAVKIGMLGSAETICAVARALDAINGVPVVLDPVMVSETGSVLLEPDAREALIRDLLPRASVTTPNLAEAVALVGESRITGAPKVQAAGANKVHAAGSAVGVHFDPRSQDAPALARAIHGLGPAVVIVTGGHRDIPADVFFDGVHLVELDGVRHPGTAAHGSGCTHSSILASRLAHGDSPLEAARAARRIAGVAVKNGLENIGHGPGPVDVLGIGGARSAG